MDGETNIKWVYACSNFQKVCILHVPIFKGTGFFFSTTCSIIIILIGYLYSNITSFVMIRVWCIF